MAAQEKNFFIEEGAIKWQKVFQVDSVNVKDVVHNLLAEGHFKEIESGEGMVTCELRGLSLNYQDLGFKRMSLPIYIPNDKFSGFVTVQVKNNRYRVTVDRIITANPRLGQGPLDGLALDKEGAFKPAFLGDPATIIDYNFDKLFSGLAKPIDDEW